MCADYYVPSGPLKDAVKNNSQRLKDRGTVFWGRQQEISEINGFIATLSKSALAREEVDSLRKKREGLQKSVERFDAFIVADARQKSIDFVLPIPHGQPLDKMPPLFGALYEHFFEGTRIFGTSEQYNADGLLGLHVSVEDGKAMKVIEKIWRSNSKLEDYNTGFKMVLNLESHYEKGSSIAPRHGTRSRSRHGETALKVLQYLQTKPEGATYKEISSGTGIAYSSTYSVIAQQIGKGYAEKKEGRVTITDIGKIRAEDLLRELQTQK